MKTNKKQKEERIPGQSDVPVPPAAVAVSTPAGTSAISETKAPSLDYSVLTAIRKINRLLATSRDTDQLLQSICDVLVEDRGFYHAWIAMTDDEGGVRQVYAAGVEEQLKALERLFANKQLPRCMEMALDREGPVVIAAPPEECDACPLADAYAQRAALTHRLEVGGQVVGCISVSVPTNYVQEEEQAVLFSEMARDVMYGLDHMAQWRELRRWQHAMRGRESRVLELKCEVNKLLAELGRTPKNTEH